MWMVELYLTTSYLISKNVMFEGNELRRCLFRMNYRLVCWALTRNLESISHLYLFDVRLLIIVERGVDLLTNVSLSSITPTYLFIVIGTNTTCSGAKSMTKRALKL